MDRFVAPTWKRQNEPFTLYVYLKSTNSVPGHRQADRAAPGRRRWTWTWPAPGVQPTLARHAHAGVAGAPVGDARGGQGAAADRGRRDSRVPRRLRARPAGRVTWPMETGGVGDRAGAPARRQAGVGERGRHAGRQQRRRRLHVYVRGKGRVLYVDDVPDGGGDMLDTGPWPGRASTPST